MAESRKSTIEITSLNIGDEKVEKTKQEKTSEEDPNGHKESEKSVLCPSSDSMKSKQPPNTKSSPTSGVTTDIGMKCLDKNDRKVEKPMQQESSKEGPHRHEESKEPVACASSSGFKDKHEESEKPVPCKPTSSDGFYAERLPAQESWPASGATPNIEMVYLDKADEKVEKYLEILPDVKTKQEEISDVDIVRNEEHEDLVSCKPPEIFHAKEPPASGSSSVLGVAHIEMTYLHKMDKENVDKYRYMTIDEDAKAKEGLGRYKALSVPCTSSDGVNELPPSRESGSDPGATSTAENLMHTDDDYDDVVIESENSSEADPGDYEEPDVLNSEQPPLPERSGSQGLTPGETSTSGETSVYQEPK